MKNILILFLSLFLLAACRFVKSSEVEKLEEKEAHVPAYKAPVVDSIGQAAKPNAIFWIDKTESKNCDTYGFASPKAKVRVCEDGKVELLHFVKKQQNYVERYIRHHLDLFKVSPKLLENGYVKYGEQYVQLRYLSHMAEKCR